MDEVEIRAFADGDQHAVVELLRGSMARGWADVATWEWKYRLRPGFDPQRVAIAAWRGAVVGCFHTTSVAVRAPGGARFTASLDGDFAIAAAFRGQGIAERLHAATAARIEAAGDRWRGGFTTPALTARFYGPHWGYRSAPSRTVELAKTL